MKKYFLITLLLITSVAHADKVTNLPADVYLKCAAYFAVKNACSNDEIGLEWTQQLLNAAVPYSDTQYAETRYREFMLSMISLLAGDCSKVVFIDTLYADHCDALLTLGTMPKFTKGSLK